MAGKGWVVNVQAPPPKCVGATAVVNYLSSYVIGGPISDRRMISDIDGMVTFGYKNYTTDRMEQATIPGAEFARRFSRHILPQRFGRVRYMGLFQAAGRAERLRTCQRLIEEAGLSRGGETSASAVRLLRHEHDEDEIEQPCDDDGERQPGLNVTMCDSCQEKRTTDPEDWLDGRQAMRLLAIVATIYVGLSRAGESMLMQILVGAGRAPGDSGRAMEGPRAAADRSDVGRVFGRPSSAAAWRAGAGSPADPCGGGCGRASGTTAAGVKSGGRQWLRIGRWRAGNHRRARINARRFNSWSKHGPA